MRLAITPLVGFLSVADRRIVVLGQAEGAGHRAHERGHYLWEMINGCAGRWGRSELLCLPIRRPGLLCMGGR